MLLAGYVSCFLAMSFLSLSRPSDRNAAVVIVWINILKHGFLSGGKIRQRKRIIK
jgi:hypothetical protein